MNKNRLIVILFASIMLISACGNSEKNQGSNNPTVLELKESVSEALGDQYWPNQTIEGEDVIELYNLTSDNYEKIMADMPLIGTNADLLIIALAKDDKIKEAEVEINEIRNKKISDTMQYPMNLEKINASRVDTIGNYVIYIQLGGDAVDLDTNTKILEACKSDNQTAYDTLREIIENH